MDVPSFPVDIWEWAEHYSKFHFRITEFFPRKLSPDPLFIFKLSGWYGFLPLFSVWLSGPGEDTQVPLNQQPWWGELEARTSAEAAVVATWLEDGLDSLLYPEHLEVACSLASSVLRTSLLETWLAASRAFHGSLATEQTYIPNARVEMCWKEVCGA